jgi:membrane associated rhomboid family serine protease
MMGPQRSTGMTPWVRRLLVANLVVYLLQLTVFVDPRFLGVFGFDPLAALARPWTFVTYLFLHGGLLHLAFNLLALYLFGRAVEDRMGSATFLAYYLACGLGGAVLSFGFALFTTVPPMIGASAAVYGVMLAYARFWPDDGILIFPFPEPVPAKWVITFAVLLSLVFAVVPARDGIAHLAHLGGFAAGYVFLRVRAWRRDEGLGTTPPELGVLVHPVPRAARHSAPAAPAPPRPPAPRTDRVQAEVDRLLDKISASGLESLTAAERKFLAEMSQRLREPR